MNYGALAGLKFFRCPCEDTLCSQLRVDSSERGSHRDPASIKDRVWMQRRLRYRRANQDYWVERLLMYGHCRLQLEEGWEELHQAVQRGSFLCEGCLNLCPDTTVLSPDWIGVGTYCRSKALNRDSNGHFRWVAT